MSDDYYIGIDLDDENAVVSLFRVGMREPETVSMVAGQEVFQIPVWMVRRRADGQWFIGEEALRLLEAGEGDAAEAFAGRAIRGELAAIGAGSCPAKELLAVFLLKLIRLAGKPGKPIEVKKLAVSLERLSREATALFAELAPSLGLLPEQIMLLDRRECFYYFAYSQPQELTAHGVCLFDCRGAEIRCLTLTRDPRTRPQLVTLSEERRRMEGEGRDEAFLEILKDYFKGRIVSSVFLVGDGFDTRWMKQSVSFLCRGRRAFIGKNLYSKGACYAAAVREKELEWPYVYLGDNELKVNVSLKVINRGKTELFTLVSAGENWYEAVGECEVILDGTPEIDFWLQPPNSREAKVEKLELIDLPERPARATRLRITAKPLSDERVRIQIRDLGFGEIFKSSEKVWDYVMSLS